MAYIWAIFIPTSGHTESTTKTKTAPMRPPSRSFGLSNSRPGHSFFNVRRTTEESEILCRDFLSMFDQDTSISISPSLSYSHKHYLFPKECTCARFERMRPDGRTEQPPPQIWSSSCLFPRRMNSQMSDSTFSVCFLTFLLFPTSTSRVVLFLSLLISAYVYLFQITLSFILSSVYNFTLSFYL